LTPDAVETIREWVTQRGLIRDATPVSVLACEPGTRRFLIGRTSGGRVLTLVVERTLGPTTWLIITGWSATDRERILLERMR
jgi:hypothetical protein